MTKKKKPSKKAVKKPDKYKEKFSIKGNLDDALKVLLNPVKEKKPD